MKLFNSILTSSVWSCDMPTRLVWITLLALADKDGFVRASPSGLARIANVPLDDCLRAIDLFEAPDAESGSKVDEGKKILRLDGGWHIVNYAEYRKVQDTEARKATWREAAKRHRAKKAASSPSTSRLQISTEAEAEAEGKGEGEEEKTQQQQNVTALPHNVTALLPVFDASVVANFPDIYRDEVAGVIRAAKNPMSVVAELKAVNSGLHGKPATWDAIGRAIHDMQVAHAPMTSRTLRAFVDGVVSPPPDRKWKKPEETRPVIGGKVPKAHSDLCQFCVASPGLTLKGRPAVIHDTRCHMYDPSVLPPAEASQ